jgi:hypothetical protein
VNIIVCVKAKEGVGKVTTKNQNENNSKTQMVQAPSSATVQNRQVLLNNKQQQSVKNKPVQVQQLMEECQLAAMQQFLSRNCGT